MQDDLTRVECGCGNPAQREVTPEMPTLTQKLVMSESSMNVSIKDDDEYSKDCVPQMEEG